MPKISSKTHKKSSTKRLPASYNIYPCRLCNRPHPLRLCRKFLEMNIADRIHTVRDKKYCTNCLAHDHSHGTCFSKDGCKHCHKFHHTLLHVNSRLVKDILPSSSPSRSRSPSPKPSSSSKKSQSAATQAKRDLSPRQATSSTSLTKIIRQNTVILLPTVLVKIGTTTSHARCLLDTGSPVSRVAKGLIDKLDLMSYTLNKETICPIVLKSRYDSSSKIEGTFRVDHRIALHTPTQSLPETFRKNFRDMFLADSKFYEASSIDIVIGVDLYSKVICQGIISRTGLPTAQSTVFGWTIYGQCFL
ncbi:uncharacterized protein ACRADG_012031 isoform 1-T2 [Cochliomyia hominivorax]